MSSGPHLLETKPLRVPFGPPLSNASSWFLDPAAPPSSSPRFPVGNPPCPKESNRLSRSPGPPPFSLHSLPRCVLNFFFSCLPLLLSSREQTLFSSQHLKSLVPFIKQRVSEKLICPPVFLCPGGTYVPSLKLGYRRLAQLYLESPSPF